MSDIFILTTWLVMGANTITYHPSLDDCLRHLRLHVHATMGGGTCKKKIKTWEDIL